MFSSLFVCDQTLRIFLDFLLPSWYINLILFLRLSSCSLIKRCYLLLKSFVPVIGVPLDLSYCTFYADNNLHLSICSVDISSNLRHIMVFLICKGQCDFSSFFLSFNLFPFSWYDRLIAWETDGLSESLFFVHVSLYTRLYVVFFGRKSSLDFVRDFIFKVRNTLSVSLINPSKPSSTTLVNFQIAIRTFLWMFTFGIFCSYRTRIYIDIQWKF